MDQFEIVEVGIGETSKRDLEGRHQRTEGWYIPLRKYSPAICVLEAITIIIFIVYLYFTASPQSHSSPGDNSIALDWIHINGPDLNFSKRCNQRKHDLKYGVKCYSNSTDKCISYPQSGSSRIEYDSDIVIVTSKSGQRFDTQVKPLEVVNCSLSSKILKLDKCSFKTQLFVYPNQRKQKIIGWGGALSDSSANNILGLTTNGTIRLLDDYFGENGLNFNMIRITIGGSDFSSRFYTNDDRPTNATNYANNFQLMEEDILYKIPILKYIQEKLYEMNKTELKIFASMWSPPIWMKTNHYFNKGYLKGSISSEVTKNIELERHYKALADLKKNFILAYQKNSIKLWGLTVMNEPVFAVQPFLDFNTMIFPREDYGNYIRKYLGPTIKKSPELSHIKLMAHDDNRRFLRNFTDPILSMEGVRGYIDGVSVHGYIDEEYDQMSWIYDKYNEKDSNKLFILPSELCSGHLPFMEKALIGNWNRGIHYALDIIKSLQNAAAGWVDWNMVLDTSGGPGWLGGRLDSPVIVDKKEDLYHKSPMYYTMGHFSRYIPVNSMKLKTTIVNDKFDYKFETVTFMQPDEKTVVTVILNNNPYPVELYVRVVDDKLESNSENGLFKKVVCGPESIITVMYKLRR